MSTLPDGPAPARLDAVTKVVTQLGFPAVVALLLLWFILGKFQSTMVDISTKIEQNGTMAAELLQGQQALLDQQRELVEQLQHPQRGGTP